MENIPTRIENLPAGTATVTPAFVRGAVLVSNAEVSLHPGENYLTLDVDVGAVITGHVKCCGRVVRGLALDVYDRDTGDLAGTSLTDELGRFTCVGLRGPANIRIARSDRSWLAVPAPSRIEIEIELPSDCCILTGRITGEGTGKRTLVALFDENRNVVATTVSDNNGHYSLAYLPSGLNGFVMTGSSLFCPTTAKRLTLLSGVNELDLPVSE